MPSVAEGIRRRPDGSLAEVTLTFLAAGVPALGLRSYRLQATDTGMAGREDGGTVIENAAYLVVADPARGGTVSVTDKRTGASVLTGPGNELVIQDEYAQHPRHGEGPWHLSPKGPGLGSASVPATVRQERCDLGSRLVASFTLDGLDVTQETVLWDDAERLEFRTHVDSYAGRDRLLRVRFPADVPGGLPVYQTATAVIGRSFGVVDVDSADHWYTLDNPAHQWFGLGSAARVRDSGGLAQAIGVGEVVCPEGPNGVGDLLRDLLAALAAAGVTATCSQAGGSRYGAIDVDSNLPDVRIAVGGPEVNPFTAEVLAAAGPGYAKALATRLASALAARLWVPGSRDRADAFGPDADVRGAGDLPVLIRGGRPGRGDYGPDRGPGRRGGGRRRSGGRRSRAHRGQGVGAAGGPLGRGAEPGHARLRGHAGRDAAHVADALMQRLASRDLDRRGPPHRAGRQRLRLAALEPCLRVRARLRPRRLARRGLQPGRRGLQPRPAHRARRRAGPGRRLGRAAVGGAGHGHARRAQAAREPARRRADRGTGRRGRRYRTAARDQRAAGHRAGAVPRGLGGVAHRPAGGVRRRSAAGGERHGFCRLPAFGTATAVFRTGSRGPAGTAAAEIVEPVYSRYWLHGKGPAPAGNLPVAVHFSPVRVALADPGEVAALALTVGCGAEPASGTVELAAPSGVTVSPATDLRYDLAPGGYAAWDLSVRVPPGTAAGRYFVTARIRDDLGQPIEDTAMVAVGERRWPDPGLPPADTLELMQADYAAGAAEADVAVLTPELRLTPGSQGELQVRVTSGLASELHGEAQLVSPFGRLGDAGAVDARFQHRAGREHGAALRGERAGDRASRAAVGAGEGHVLRAGPVHRGDQCRHRACQLT